ncbi:prolipoprotein diacylglyceryl transferase [Fundidesulfovibrio soli]|uniref:prolipoprotein diacylglyceryl transferase n=1 Tax=Fundidesulfovibrio soli TaxID=2922716 RepID=UPI001FB047D5|nr:prolipoprotein diacylglyceryl transferase [Fundidesulfovibrio soli]
MIKHPDFDPVAIGLGPLQVRWYGLMYLAGFVTGWLLGRRRAARPGSGWTPAMVDDFITWCVLGLVLGARLGYVAFYDLPAYLSDPLAIFQIWNGGMSFHGGMIGLCVVVWIFARKHGKTFLEIGDFLCPLAPPGLFFGRIGNFINGELWGGPTSMPWGVIFPDPRGGGVPRHPSQLYEAGLEGLVLFTILWIYSAKPRISGHVMGMFLACYGLFRFLVELIREPDPQLGYLAWGWLTMGQLLSLPMVLVGVALLLRRGSAATNPAR